MRDVSAKSNTLRTAKASATLNVNAATIAAIRSGNVPKADPLAVARVAGIQAAKNTAALIPYCHQVPLDFVEVDVELQPKSIYVISSVKAIWKTGVEMEALVAASTAALTLYDMLKIIDEEMEVVSVRLLEKKGGKSSMKIPAQKLKTAVVVLSDSVSKKKSKDRSGKILVEMLGKFSLKPVRYRIVPDERNAIEKELKTLADVKKVDLILTTGGTGVSPRDVTPEATLEVIDRRLEGVEEALRSYGQDRTPTSMLGRAVAGVRGKTVIVNFPGSVGGVTDGFHAIFPTILHTFSVLKGEKH